MVEHTIDQDFLDHVDSKLALYNPRGRTERQMRMDIECEHHEYMMIKDGTWSDVDDWRIDGIMCLNGTEIAVDVKFISKYYNLTPTKVCNILQQRHVLSGYLFMEWKSRPRRPLQVGDKISYRQLGYLSWEKLVDNILPSTNYKDWGTSHYVNVHKLLRK